MSGEPWTLVCCSLCGMDGISVFVRGLGVRIPLWTVDPQAEVQTWRGHRDCGLGCGEVTEAP